MPCCDKGWQLDLLYCLGKKSLGRIPEAECMELPHLALPQKTGSKRNVKPCSEALRSYSNSPKCWVEKGVVGLGLIFLYLQGQRGCRWALCWDCSPAAFTGRVDNFNCRTCQSFHAAESLCCAGRDGWTSELSWQVAGLSCYFTSSLSALGKYGVPYPPLFFLRPSYWFKPKGGYVGMRAISESSPDPVPSSNSEPMPPGFDGKEAIR